MFKWIVKPPVTAKNAIYLEDNQGNEGRPFKARFLQAGLVKYDFGVCLLQKETIDKFINTFVGVPVIIDHKDFIAPDDVVGKIQNIWFSPEDGWFWCSGIITDEKAIELIENGYNVSCQYAITEYIENLENKLHNGNPYDKEILNGVFEHLAIVKNPRYEGAFIAANAYLAKNNEFKEEEHLRDEDGKFTDGNNSDNKKFNDEIDKIKSGEYPRSKQVIVAEKPSDVWLKAGLQNKKIVMPAAVFHKATTEKHKVDEETIRKFPELLKDPPYIFKSSTEPGSFVGVLDAIEKEGDVEKPLIVAVKPVHDRVEVNIITSTYGKDKEFVKRETKKGNLLYTRKKTASNNIVALLATETLNPSDNIISNPTTDFNPIDYINELDKGGQMDEKLKELCAGVVNAFLKAKNEADEEKKKEEKKKEEEEKEAKGKAENEDDDDKDKEREKASNEDTDKRKQIDEIGGILKGKVDEELWRTIIGKVEKIAHTKSEAGTADNKAKNKCKNEDEHKEKEYEDLKEKIYEEVKNQIAKNSMDTLKSAFYEGEADVTSPYQTREDRLQAGMKY